MAKRAQLVSQHLENISHELEQIPGCYSQLCSWSSRNLRTLSEERTLLRRPCRQSSEPTEKSFAWIATENYGTDLACTLRLATVT